MSGLTRFLLLPVGFALIAAFIVGGMLLIRGRSPGGRGLGGRGGAAGHGRIRKTAQVEAPATASPTSPAATRPSRSCARSWSSWRSRALPARRRPDAAGVVLHGRPAPADPAGEGPSPASRASPSSLSRGRTSWTPTSAWAPPGVRDLFAQARRSRRARSSSSVKIDAIRRTRGAGRTGADSERESTLNQLLVELDGFGDRERIVVIAATNRLGMLDQALLRPGRFDHRVQVGLPAEAGRLAILSSTQAACRSPGRSRALPA